MHTQIVNKRTSSRRLPNRPTDHHLQLAPLASSASRLMETLNFTMAELSVAAMWVVKQPGGWVFNPTGATTACGRASPRCL